MSIYANPALKLLLDPDDPLLTPGDAALLLDLSPRRVARWCDAGLVPHFRTIGGHRRIRASELHAAFQAGVVPPRRGGPNRK
jgi:excisionase family DNA binding protein